MADSNQNEEVIEIVTALSSFFRITLSKGNDWITVREEVKHINSYLIIQKIRYSDILNFEIQVDEAIYDCKILKLTLQPIVENALYHGIKNKRMGGIIKVRGSKKNDHIVFEVTDNGIGMTENKVNELVNEMKDTKEAIIKESGFGLNNVHKRIILYYGKEYGVNIQSEFQKGTKLTITIPVCVD
jgi:two-component system sensor histidine kinase YesM